MKKSLAGCLLHQPVLNAIKQAVRSACKPLLKFGGIVTIPSTTSRFIAKEKFISDTSETAKVKISGLSTNFQVWFLFDDGKIEDPITSRIIICHTLLKKSSDRTIIKELGGQAKAVTTLYEMFFLIENQSKGEDGTLLNNGSSNAFYIKDKSGVLRTVFVFWCDDGWRVRAYSVGDPRGWRDGHQVFSRNSILDSFDPKVSAQA